MNPVRRQAVRRTTPLVPRLTGPHTIRRDRPGRPSRPSRLGTDRSVDH